MTFVLAFNKTGAPSLDFIDPEDPEMRMVIAFLRNYQTPQSARRFRGELKGVMAGTEPPSVGGGDRFYQDIGPIDARIARLFDKEPIGYVGVAEVTIPTALLLDLVEQYIAHMENAYQRA